MIVFFASFVRYNIKSFHRRQTVTKTGSNAKIQILNKLTFSKSWQLFINIIQLLVSISPAAPAAAAAAATL